LAKSPPVIGITLDAEPPGGYSKFPWYALRENYSDMVRRFGGVPILLPHEPALTDTYLDMIDGLIVTGGAFDVDPALFGAVSRHPAVTTKERRTEFELAVTKGAIARDMPVLGICGGEQLLNVVLGGTLVQHIPDEVANALKHEQSNPRSEPGHTVKVARGTLLHRITGAEQLSINSAHHQAVREVGAGGLGDDLLGDAEVLADAAVTHERGAVAGHAVVDEDARPVVQGFLVLEVDLDRIEFGARAAGGRHGSGQREQHDENEGSDRFHLSVTLSGTGLVLSSRV